MHYRDDLPQLSEELFLTDGGLETTLIFHDGIDLPEFAAIDLCSGPDGLDALRSYYRRYLAIARERELGFVLESPTWRASPGWAERIGYSEEQLKQLNMRAIELMEELRDEQLGSGSTEPIVISGCIGPQGDGYSPEQILSSAAAQSYHRAQVETFAGTAADMVTAITMTYVEEAIGIAVAAGDAGMPSAISFTVETDGRLPSGEALGEAIERVDVASEVPPAYYMINCAHPTHFAAAIGGDEPWRERIRGLRANASTMSHTELDEATELDEGDPVDLGARHGALRDKLPHLTVLGGCCGTDHRHVGEICTAWIEAG
ncbi:MAG: homocysteine S-methyltransferase family protein [Solirubrobacterales bacterium]